MFDSHHAICELIYVTLILFALHYIQQNARSTVQTEQAMPEMLEGVGPGRVSGSRYELFRHICGTVYVPQVCLFVYLETDVRKKFIWYRCDPEVQKDPGKTAL